MEMGKIPTVICSNPYLQFIIHIPNTSHFTKQLSVSRN